MNGTSSRPCAAPEPRFGWRTSPAPTCCASRTPTPSAGYSSAATVNWAAHGPSSGSGPPLPLTPPAPAAPTRALHLHANTLTYRLDRWHELTGLDHRDYMGLVTSRTAVGCV